MNDYKTQTKEEMQLILIALTQQGNLNLIKEIVEQNIIDFRFEDEHLLKLAAYHGKFDLVDYYIDKGADPSSENEELLRVAAKSGQYHLVRKLIDKGADFKINDNQTIKNASLNNYPTCLSIIQYLIIEKKQDIEILLNYANTDKEILEWAKAYKETEKLHTKLSTDLNNNNNTNKSKLKI